ncbi:MAG: hypothetical protein Q8R42_02735 [Desulfocapsaceae bacterium]|nr:hypothetical protein [Desulfocapsaceae bacterium]
MDVDHPQQGRQGGNSKTMEQVADKDCRNPNGAGGKLTTDYATLLTHALYRS